MDTTAASAQLREALAIRSADPERARALLLELAQDGYLTAMALYGWELRTIDRDEAQRWLEKAAVEGNRAGLSYLGRLLFDSDPKRAVELLNRAAELNDKQALWALGCFYAKSDRERAVEYFERAANEEHADATYCLSLIVSDRVAAQAYLEKAAQLGSPPAQMRLSGMLPMRKRALATKLLRTAAEAGNIEAMRLYGLRLRVRRPAESLAWLTKASASGDKLSRALVDSWMVRTGIGRWVYIPLALPGRAKWYARARRLRKQFAGITDGALDDEAASGPSLK